MPTNFPGGVDALTNPTSTDPLSSPSHSEQHTNANDAIEAIETEVLAQVDSVHDEDHIISGAGTTHTDFPGGSTTFLRGDGAFGVPAHADLAAHDTLGLAKQEELDAHAAASDPHTGYQKESEKAAASGYASLDSGTKVPIAQVPTGTTSTTVALGDAAAALDATHAAAADPHTAYQRELGIQMTGGGTSFPGSPTTNDLYYRSDLFALCVWDGSRWDELPMRTDIIPNHGGTVLPVSVDSTMAYWVAPRQTFRSDINLRYLQMKFHIVNGTALSASHKWTATLRRGDDGAVIATMTIDSGSLNVWRTLTTDISVLLGSTTLHLYVHVAKTGTPGNIHFLPSLEYFIVYV